MLRKTRGGALVRKREGWRPWESVKSWAHDLLSITGMLVSSVTHTDMTESVRKRFTKQGRSVWWKIKGQSSEIDRKFCCQRKATQLQGAVCCCVFSSPPHPGGGGLAT